MEAVSVQLAQPPPVDTTILAEGLSSPSDLSQEGSPKTSPAPPNPAVPADTPDPSSSTAAATPRPPKPTLGASSSEQSSSSSVPPPAFSSTSSSSDPVPDEKGPREENKSNKPEMKTKSSLVASPVERQKSILKPTAISPVVQSSSTSPVIAAPVPPPVRKVGGKGVTFAKQAPAKVSKPRTPRKKVPLAVYQSEISDNKIGIKLCIKKSVDVVVAKAAKKVASRITGKPNSSSSGSGSSATSSGGGGQTRKQRGKKRKALDDSDSDEMNYRRRRRREQKNNNNELVTNNNTHNHVPAKEAGVPGRVPDPSAAAAASSTADQLIEVDQSCWALTLPENVLRHIFQFVTTSEGCLPTLVKLSSVSSLWRRVAMQPALWHTMDLTTWVKERHRNELKLKWFIENRLGGCKDLNLANWKVMNVQCVMDRLVVNSPKLSGLILSGWKSLMSDHLMFIATEMKNLQRIDLSAINTEVNANKTAVGLQSLSNAVQAMGERLRHLHLANNRLGGLPQLINSLATHCPNLALLDLSNITTMAVSHAVLPIEKLQTGCPKLKVFRITNAQVTLGSATVQEQMDSPGFAELEELSIASFSRTICDDFVQRILKNSTKLKLLDVRGCPRITHDSLIRLPAWDLKHLFLSGCSVTRDTGSGLELIASKWAHSLVEFDLAWGNAQKPLDSALRALAEKRGESRLNHLDLCGTSVSLEAVQEVLANCPSLNSINLSSCRSLPRGMKRLMQGPAEMKDLREALGVELKVKTATTTAD